MPIKPKPTLQLSVPRSIPAPIEKVFRALTEPERIAKWMAATGRLVMTPPKVDSLFFAEMAYESRKYPHYGRYLRIEPNKVVEFTWMSEGTYGHESIVTIELAARGNSTDVKLTHAGLPDEEMVRDHTQGWAEILELLEKEAV